MEQPRETLSKQGLVLGGDDYSHGRWAETVVPCPGGLVTVSRAAKRGQPIGDPLDPIRGPADAPPPP